VVEPSCCVGPDEVESGFTDMGQKPEGSPIARSLVVPVGSVPGAG
jgi:hypothetical protein